MTRFLAPLCSVVLALSVVSPGMAQSKEYSLTHKFNVNLNANQTFKGRWAWTDFAHARDKTGAKEDASGYAEVGFVPPSNDLRNALAMKPAAWAYAESSYDAKVTGALENHIEGIASIDVPNGGITAVSRAFSQIGWKVGTFDAAGKVHWEPHWHFDTVRGGAGVFRDPLDLRILDLDTGLEDFDRLWDVDFDMIGESVGSFEGGLFSFDGEEGSIHWLVGGDEPGVLDLAVKDRLVTSVTASGVFHSQAPHVGDSSKFTMRLGDGNGGFDLAYDHGGRNTNGYETEFVLETSAEASVVPEPVTLTVFGFGLAALACRRHRRA